MSKEGSIMLIQFKFKNYKCFREETVLDLTATQEKSHDDHIVEREGNKLLTVAAIHGANASGKTKVIDAFYAMAFIVRRSFDLDVDENLYISPFLLSNYSKKEPTEFEIFINLGKYEYQYGFIATTDEIKEEWLYRKPFNINSKAAKKCLFERTAGNKIEVKNEFKEAKDYVSFVNNERTLFLSVLGRRGIGDAANIYEWFSSSKCVDTHRNNPAALNNALRFLKKEEKVKKEFTKLLKEIDPSLLNIEIEEEVKGDKINYTGYGIHSNIEDQSNVKFFLWMESEGTIKVINTLPYIINHLQNGGTLFIDELDIQLHPLLYRHIISMFYNKEINKENAQLIFTAHSTLLFNSEDMRRDQIFIVEKNKKGESNLYSLSEFRNLRIDANYEKKYLSGNFGGIPFLDR